MLIILFNSLNLICLICTEQKHRKDKWFYRDWKKGNRKKRTKSSRCQEISQIIIITFCCLFRLLEVLIHGFCDLRTEINSLNICVGAHTGSYCKVTHTENLIFAAFIVNFPVKSYGFTYFSHTVQIYQH